MKYLLERLIIFLVAILTVALFSLILGFPLMWLWNWIIPDIFAIGKITFWQAFGINLLCGLLFRSTTTVNK